MAGKRCADRSARVQWRSAALSFVFLLVLDRPRSSGVRDDDYRDLCRPPARLARPSLSSSWCRRCCVRRPCRVLVEHAHLSVSNAKTSGYRGERVCLRDYPTGHRGLLNDSDCAVVAATVSSGDAYFLCGRTTIQRSSVGHGYLRCQRGDALAVGGTPGRRRKIGRGPRAYRGQSPIYRPLQKAIEVALRKLCKSL